jgi:hypothetical protein
VAFFGALALLFATAALSPAVWAAVGAAYLVALPAVVVLVAVQAAMRQVCTWCLGVHAAVVVGAAASWTFVRHGWSTETVAALGALALHGAVLLFAVVPYLTRSPRVQEFVARQRRLASSPYATLAYLLTQAPTDVRGAECGVRLDGPPTAHELVVFAHPTCPQCASTVQDAAALAAAGRAQAFVAIAPRDDTPAEAGMCEALVAVGLAAGADAFVRAYFAAKRRYGDLRSDDPTDVLAAELSLDASTVREALPRARRVAARAAAFADDHVEGMPAVFVDSRLYPYTAPLSHLAALLDRHEELLEPMRRPLREAGP